MVPTDANPGKSKSQHKANQKSNDNLAHASISSASSLMGLQLLSRLVTFGLNQALIRIASPQVFGTASIQFELLLSTILFLSREGVRNGVLRGSGFSAVGTTKGAGENEDAIALEIRTVKASNLAILPLYLGFSISAVTAVLYRRYSSAATKSQPYFGRAIFIYVVAAVIELMSEPMHIRAVQSIDMSTRVRAEGSAVVARTVVTFLVLLADSFLRIPGQLGLLAFAFGQFAYAVILFAFYSSKYGWTTSLRLRPAVTLRKDNTPRSLKRRISETLNCYFDEELLQVSFALTAQGLVKHFLTEGDKLIIARINPLKDQGGYAVASNYGSLIARIIFQPMEESSRLFFAMTLASPEQSITSLASAAQMLTSILLIQSHLFLFLLCLAPPYLPIILRLLLSKSYLYNTSAPKLLAAWIWYIPVLGVNGILEAFVSSVASPADLQRQSRWMTLFSAIFIGAVLIFYNVLHLGDVALVYANIVNLLARIIYCASFISNYFTIRSRAAFLAESTRNSQSIFRWRDVVPPWPVVLVGCMASAATQFSAMHFIAYHVVQVDWTQNSRRLLSHLTVGVVSGLICLAACWLTERESILSVVRFIAERRRPKKE